MPLWGTKRCKRLDRSRAQVRRRRKNDRLVIAGGQKAGAARRHVLAARKTLASKNEFAALGRFEPSRAERAARNACGILAPRRCSADATQKPAARLQVVVAKGCPR